MKQISAVNDFVVKFANVNGSGSASANEMFAKSILRIMDDLEENDDIQDVYSNFDMSDDLLSEAAS